MAGRWEVGLPKSGACNLKDQLVKATLQRVRSQGHPYVELRADGKRYIFFCTLCLAPCYSDSVLLDHLKGNLHMERLSAAKVTLLKPNPWPFSDGVHFFDTSSDGGTNLDAKESCKSKPLDPQNNSDNLAIVAYGDNVNPGNDNQNGLAVVPGCKVLNHTGGSCDLLVPGVLIKEEVSDLKVRFIGDGLIAARFRNKDEVSDEISRIWCEWLGKKGNESKTVEHDFSVITFSYNYSLARKGLLDDVKLLLTAPPVAGEVTVRKRKKSFSDPEDVSESLSQSNQYDSSGEESSASNGASPKLLSDRDDSLLQSRFLSSKTVRRELRKQQRLAAERLCDICQQKMLPDKDVATLFNAKAGKLACSSRNTTGAFHVFHSSCLILWILLCEHEMLTNKPDGSKPRRKSRRKNIGKQNGRGKLADVNIQKAQIRSVFCPECQGTGVEVEGDELEKPAFPLSEMFKYKMKVSDGRRAWMKSPEDLENCSMGFHFPSPSEETLQEEVLALKSLHFYRSDG
ncbi:unnamed protein product [Linum trigynum]|uniref:C2H2-type domain-containing protein n=1 Tax=Linum trigynum TaxID=586398 RepID=A0AAV2G8G5_9ROSI